MRELKPFLDIINKHKDEIEQEKNKFNIFYELDIEHKETVLHSKFIAYLLNPNANHNIGGKFLESFFRKCKLEEKLMSQTDTFNISIEYYIGSVNNDEQEGGRIDILIENNDYCIAIENKIYAGFQPKQLERYKSFLIKKAKENKKKCYLILLTPFANNQSEYTAIKNEFDKLRKKLNFKHISYSNEISEWINSIINPEDNNKLNSNELQSILTQYNDSINRLCNKTSNREMEEELIDNISSNEQSLRTYHQVIKLKADEIWYKIVNDHIINKLSNYKINEKKILRSENEFNSQTIIGSSEILFHTNIVGLNTKVHDILFLDEKLLSKNIAFGFEWNQTNWQLEYGLKYIDTNKAELTKNDEFCKKLKSDLGLNLLETTDETLWYADNVWEEYKDWNNYSTETLSKAIKGKVFDGMINLLEKVFKL